MPTFTRSFGPVSAQRIAAFERRLNIQLPADYKRFLRTTNGGIPKPNHFLVPDRGGALADFLYGLRTERMRGDLEFEQKQATLYDPLPPGFITIGHDPGGSSILLATLGDKAGRVFFWDRAGLWVRDDGHNTFPVATSFTEFLESLGELPADA